MAEEKRKVIEHREVTVVLPVVKAPAWLQGFVDFVREQGVVGLSVGLILGIAAKSVVDSLVANIFNPIIGMFTGGGALGDKYLCLKDGAGVCSSKLGYGKLFSDLISFMIVAMIVYFVVKKLKLDKIDKKPIKPIVPPTVKK